MIIKFDQTPEEYFRLSRAAYNRGEYDRAFLYGVKALRGKGCVEYKVSCAEILLAMGRYADAASIALDALCHGRGFRAKLYDTLASAASGMGAFYDALHYVAKKAQYEGDDDTLDAMDEVMQELEADEAPREEPQFFRCFLMELKTMIGREVSWLASFTGLDGSYRVFWEPTTERTSPGRSIPVLEVRPKREAYRYRRSSPRRSDTV